MTRINLVQPSQLCDKHLMAEYRELIRIPNMVVSGKLKSQYPDAPKQYTLGPGHVKFFVDKLPWLFHRHCELYDELIFRWFNVVRIPWMRIINSDQYTYKYMHEWDEPSQSEIDTNISRLILRMPANPRFTNRGIPDYWMPFYMTEQEKQK